MQLVNFSMLLFYKAIDSDVIPFVHIAKIGI